MWFSAGLPFTEITAVNSIPQKTCEAEEKHAIIGFFENEEAYPTQSAEVLHPVCNFNESFHVGKYTRSRYEIISRCGPANRSPASVVRDIIILILLPPKPFII